MRDLNQKSSALVFVLFYALFGFAISFTLTTADSYRAGAAFCQYQYSTSEILFFFKEGIIPDLYRNLMYTLVRPFTANPKFMFGIFGAIIGIFSYLTLRQFYRVWIGKFNIYFYILVICAISVISFTNINGVRFWTATSVFAYFVILLFYHKKRWAFLGIVITPIIHFSFYFSLACCVVYFLLNLFFRNNTKFFFIICAICFVISVLIPRGITADMLSDEEMEIGNTSINRKVQTYSTADSRNTTTGLEQISLYRQVNSLYTNILKWVNKIGIFLLLLQLYLKEQKLIIDSKERTWLNFVLLFFGLANIATLAFSSGHRFIYVADILFAFLMVLIYNKNRTNEVAKLILWSIPCFFYLISFNIVNAPRLVTSMLWYLPSPVVIIDGWDFAPIDFIY